MDLSPLFPQSTLLRFSYRRKVRFCAALFCCGSTIAGCSSLSSQTIAEHKIADDLPSALGPAQNYQVHIDGDAFALTRGRARRVTVKGIEVRVSPSLTLDTLDFIADDVSFDKAQKRLDHVGSVTFVGTIGERNLTEYLDASSPQRTYTVRLRQSDVQAILPLRYGPLHTSASVAGTLAPETFAGNMLDFTADSARLSILPVPAFLVNKELADINPVVDLSKAKVPISIQSTQVENGVLILRGTADLNALTVPGDASLQKTGTEK